MSQTRPKSRWMVAAVAADGAPFSRVVVPVVLTPVRPIPVNRERGKRVLSRGSPICDVVPSARVKALATRTFGRKRLAAEAESRLAA